MRTVALLVCALSAAAAFSHSNLFEQPQELLTCPTATTCPYGTTGSVCEFPLCPVRGVAGPPQFDSGFDIDVDNLANCMNTYQLPVDSHVTALTVSVQSNQAGSGNLYPMVTVYDPSGFNITNNFFVTTSSSAWVGTINRIAQMSAFGMYSVVVTSSGGPCTYQARAESQMTLSIGYTSGQGYMYNDMPNTVGLPENTIGGILGHVNGLFRPGFAYSWSVFSSPGNVNQLVATYPVVERFNCAYDIYAGPVICTTESTYYFKLSGIDEQGFAFMRTDILPCTNFNTTTTPMPASTTTAPLTCLNGGVYNYYTNQCDCGFYFTGTVCQQPVCFNGGTPVQNACVCPPGYADQNCLEVACPAPNTNQAPFSAYGRTLTMIIQNTQSMSGTIQVIKDFASELYYSYQTLYPGYITNFVVVAFNPDSATLICNTNDGNTFLQCVWNIALSNSTTCNQQFNQALSKALNLPSGDMQTAPYSDTYVFANSPADVSNSSANLNTLNLIENYKNSLFFYIVAPQSGAFCAPWSDPGFQKYRDLAQFSGGLALLLQQDPSTTQGLQMIKTSYERQQIYQKQFPDCTSTTGVDVYVPIDSHSVSVEVTVQGNRANLDIFYPDGVRSSPIPLLDDYYSAVRQVISPCPKNWLQRDSMCFSGEFTSATWYDANAACIAMNANLLTILNPERQQLVDLLANGVTTWIALNKVNSANGTPGSPWYWQTGNSTIPLGQYYNNWNQPGQPVQTPNYNCVIDQSTNGKGTWYNVDCNSKFNYVCEKPALAPFGNSNFPPGIYRINLQSYDSSSNDPIQPPVYGKECLVTVNVQSDMQMFYGYVTNMTQDNPTNEPKGSSAQNRFVANFTNLDPTLASVSTVEFLDLNYNLLQAKQMSHRVSPCAYQYVSDVFSCPSGSFATLMTGIDDRGYTFNRYDWGVCIGSPSQLEDAL